MRVGYQEMVVDGRGWKRSEEKSDFETSQKIVRPSKNLTRKRRPRMELELIKAIRKETNWQQLKRTETFEILQRGT